MKFHPTPLRGAYTIELEKRGDDRGFFARFFCQKEFEAAGIPTSVVQINNSLSAKAGTLRGMHYQLPPAAEIKVVRCIRGALFDVIIDLRPDSPTFGKWFGAELTAETRLMMFVPQGFAHGILTLTDDTEAFHLVNAFYGPDQERGLRFDDPKSRIKWPQRPVDISAKDRHNAPQSQPLCGKPRYLCQSFRERNGTTRWHGVPDCSTKVSSANRWFGLTRIESMEPNTVGVKISHGMPKPNSTSKLNDKA